MKIGIMGHGPIVSNFLDAISYVEQAEATAIYNRPASAEFGRALAAKYNIPATYQDFDAFLADDRIDTVYIALPNSLHYPYALRVLEAGKHAIVEKPFTALTSHARHLAQVAREKGLFLFEGITVCHMPHVKKLKELLPLIGDISVVHCNYSQYSSRYDQLMNGELTTIFDPRLAGGCLMDINCYNIHFMADVFGAPRSIHYYPRMNPCGTDVSGVAVMQYPSFAASCVGAKDSACDSYAMIQGRWGNLTIDGPVGFAPGVTLRLRGQEPKTWQLQPYENRQVYEIAEMARILDESDYKERDRLLDHSILVSRLLEEARLSAGISFPDIHS